MAKDLILQRKNQKSVELVSLKPQTQDDISFLAIVLTAKSSSLLSFSWIVQYQLLLSLVLFVCCLFVIISICMDIQKCMFLSLFYKKL